MSRLERPNPPPDDVAVAQAWYRPATRVLPVTPRGHLGFTAPGRVAFARPGGAWHPGTDLLLGTVAGAPVFVRLVADDDALAELLAPARPEVITGLRGVLDEVDDDLDLALAAVALAQWHAGAGFCPACGSPTRVVPDGGARACPACQTELYPRIDPAVIVAVVGPGDRLLLARQPVWAPRRYSVLAGYVEAAESAEQALRREVAEEVDLHDLTEIAYVGSQPWPFPRSLMLGYTARTASADFRVDGREIEHARWFTRDELASAVASREIGLPSRHSTAMRLINRWWHPDGPSAPPPADRTPRPASGR